jgi:cysteine desulfurase
MGIYLDHAATTPLRAEVKSAMIEAMDRFGNPSSAHQWGREAKAAINRYRKTIAEIIGCSPTEIIFTSGGTESNNMAIKGLLDSGRVRHLVTGNLEHDAVLKPVQKAEEKGFAVDFVEHNDDGQITLKEIQNRPLTDRTLVSLMMVNNEIGILNDVRGVANYAGEKGAIFHTDAVQALGIYDINVSDLPVDMLSCSAHKFNGPKGSGFLYVRSGTNISPLSLGGSQENGIRPGTTDIVGICGLAIALELAHANRENHYEHLRKVKTRLVDRLKSEIPSVCFNGSVNPSKSSPKILSVSIDPALGGDNLLFKMDLHGVALSGGSACSSGAQKASHVQEALGNEWPTLRFSFGTDTTLAEIDSAADILKKVLKMT